MKKIKRLKYGEVYEIVGLDSLTLSSLEYDRKMGLTKETIERIEQRQRMGQKISSNEM